MSEANLAKFRKAVARELGGRQLSPLLDAAYRPDGVNVAAPTVRNWLNPNVGHAPNDPWVVLHLERALGAERGSLLKVLGWKVPAEDSPPITRLSPTAKLSMELEALRAAQSADRRSIERFERWLEDLQKESSTTRELLEVIAKSLADRAEPHPDLAAALKAPKATRRR